jgi:hypothetical protein
MQQRTKMNRSSFVWGFSGFLIVLAFSTYIYILHWPALKGVLFGNWIEYETTEGEIVQSGSRISPYQKNIRNFDAFIEYLYKVDGIPYFSHQINFDLLSLRNIEHYQSKYPVNKLVTVYYEKGNPSFSVLEPEIRSLKVLQGPLLVSLLITVYLFLWLYCGRFQWCIKCVKWIEGLK